MGGRNERRGSDAGDCATWMGGLFDKAKHLFGLGQHGLVVLGEELGNLELEIFLGLMMIW